MPTEKAIATEPVEPENRRLAGVRELLRLLVKAQKAQRLYETKNAVSERLETDLFERMTAFIEEHGEVQLAVLESQLRCDGESVYESGERNNDDLAFLLYRDGIRRLSFSPGLEREEVRAFLRCLNRVALLANDQDDLVTLLWEQDFHSIRYFAIEELTGNDSYPRLQDQLRTGESGEAGGEGAGMDSVSLDLQQPVSTVPVEACRLETAEIEALREELACEEKALFRQLVSELAVELALLEDDDTEHAEISKNLIDIADRMIDEGDLVELIGLHEHVDGLATMLFSKEPRVVELASKLTRALVEPLRLSAFLEKVEAVHQPKPEALTAFLARLGPSTSTTLIEWMGRFSSPAYRRSVGTALSMYPDRGLEAMEQSLPMGPPPTEPHESLQHRQFVRELLHLSSRLSSDQALPLLGRLLGAKDGETRRESFVALSRYPDEEVVTRCLERLSDRDPEIRATALDSLVRRNRNDLGLEILERSLASGDLDERSLNEKRRLFAAVAKLAGNPALESFRKLLFAREDRWFASQKDRQFGEAVAHGIRVVGTEEALRLLKECAEQGPKFARAACLKELSSKRSART